MYQALITQKKHTHKQVSPLPFIDTWPNQGVTYTLSIISKNITKYNCYDEIRQGTKKLEVAYATAISGGSMDLGFVAIATYVIHEGLAATSTNSATSETDLTSLDATTT